MQTLLKDLLLGVFLVCLTLAFTTLVQAATAVPAGIQAPGTQSNVSGKLEQPGRY